MNHSNRRSAARSAGPTCALAQRFEEAWNDKRDTLRDHLADLKTRTTDTKNAWQDLDRELATASEVSDGNDGS